MDGTNGFLLRDIPRSPRLNMANTELKKKKERKADIDEWSTLASKTNDDQIKEATSLIDAGIIENLRKLADEVNETAWMFK